MSEFEFGTLSDGRVIKAVTITNPGGMELTVLSLGAIIHSIKLPMPNGQKVDVVLGQSDPEKYLDRSTSPFFGALVGRVAGRITNGGKVMIESKAVEIACNEAGFSLHGGPHGFNKAVWEIVEVAKDHVSLTHTSPHNDQGYPGNLQVRVTYGLSAANELAWDIVAITDHTTIVNMTNHVYLNLHGHDCGQNVGGHTLAVRADRFVQSDASLCATGELCEVSGSRYEKFCSPVGELMSASFDNGGIDTTFCLPVNANMKFAGVVAADGRSVEVYTNQLALHIYSGNFLDGIVGKEGAKYAKHAGFCVETQNYPDAVNHRNFPSILLRPGDTYKHCTLLKFNF